MPPSLHPPHPQSHKLKRRHLPAAMAKKGLAALLYKLRDVHHHHRSPQSPSSPSTPHYSQRCYPPSAWPWPSCRHPRTSSFRARPDENNAAAAVFRTVNSVFDDAASSEHFAARRRSSMSVDDPRSPALMMPGVHEEEQNREEMALVVRGVRSERLFFDPAGAEFLPTPKQQVTHCACLPLSDSDRKTPPVESSPFPTREMLQQPGPAAHGENDDEASVKYDDEEAAAPAAASPSVKDEEAAAAAAVKGGAVVVTVESKDPYGDFRASMAEMVAAHGLRDWDAMEELLAWYLKLNAKGVHAAIVGAFIDLLVTMQHHQAAPSPSPSSSCITFEEYSSATFDDEDKS